MLTIIASVEVKEGKMEEAISVLKEVIPKIKNSEPGLLDYIPHTVKGKEYKNLIIFYERYTDETALKLHMTNLGKSLAKFIPLLEPGMEMKTCYEILDK